LTENCNNQIVKSLILKITEEKKPESIRQLIYLVKMEAEIPEKKLFTIIKELEDEKKLQFNEIVFPESVTEYVFSLRGEWYWIVLFLSILTAFFVFAIPDNLVPQIYARSVLGIAFVIYFPGYTIIKALYPISVPLELHSIMLDNIERIALSLGLSLAVSPMVGLILYYTPWGLNLALSTLSLLTVTAIFSTLAIWREYHARRVLFLRRLIVVTKYELYNNTIKFFDVGGRFKNRLILIKQIPINEITTIESRGNELSITWKGITYLFFMKYDSKAVEELREKIRGMLNGELA